jgi:hypothetical protein
MGTLDLKILFKRKGNLIKPGLIRSSVINFGNSYNKTVRMVINNSRTGLNRKIFFENVAILMPNFKMIRQGPFIQADVGINRRNGVTVHGIFEIPNSKHQIPNN